MILIPITAATAQANTTVFAGTVITSQKQISLLPDKSRWLFVRLNNSSARRIVGAHCIFHLASASTKQAPMRQRKDSHLPPHDSSLAPRKAKSSPQLC